MQETRLCLNRIIDLLAGHQQKTYTLLKMWPSLVIGSILRDLEDSPDFLNTIVKDLPLELKTTPFFLAETETVTCPIHAMLKLELAGLWKTMGHLIVNMNITTAC